MKPYILLIFLAFFVLNSCKKTEKKNTIEADKFEAWKTVEEINKAWTVDGNIQILKRVFHEDMIIIAKNGFSRFEGRDTILSIYKNFVKGGDVLFFNVSNPKVNVYDNTAVVCYDYKMKAVILNKGEIESYGRDIYILVKKDNKWTAIVNHFGSFYY